MPQLDFLRTGLRTDRSIRRIKILRIVPFDELSHSTNCPIRRIVRRRMVVRQIKIWRIVIWWIVFRRIVVQRIAMTPLILTEKFLGYTLGEFFSQSSSFNCANDRLLLHAWCCAFEQSVSCLVTSSLMLRESKTFFRIFRALEKCKSPPGLPDGMFSNYQFG
jgi:hypothetical protein